MRSRIKINENKGEYTMTDVDSRQLVMMKDDGERWEEEQIFIKI